MDTETLDDYFKKLEAQLWEDCVNEYKNSMKKTTNKSFVFRGKFLRSNSVQVTLDNNRELSVLLAYIEAKYLSGDSSLENILLELRNDSAKSFKLSNSINILFRTWRKDYAIILSETDKVDGVADLTKYSNRCLVEEFAKFKVLQKAHQFLKKQHKFYLDEANMELSDDEMEAARKNAPEDYDIMSSDENWVEIRRKKEIAMGFTLARRVAAMVYIFNQMRIKNVASDASIARFIEFLTGMSYDNIYKLVLSLHKRGIPATYDDLKFIRPFFENLDWDNVVGKIDKVIEDIEKEESPKKKK